MFPKSANFSAKILRCFSFNMSLLEYNFFFAKLQVFIGIVFLLALVPRLVFAHVGYVLSESEVAAHRGADFAFFLETFRHASTLVVVAVLVVAPVLFVIVASRTRFVRVWCERIKVRAHSYTDLVPWMLRLGVGIALIGAGTKGVFISPLLQDAEMYSLIQILLGFLLLAGFLLPLAALAALALFLIGVATTPALVGNLDFAALTVALLMLAYARPGLDDIFGIPFFSPLKRLSAYAPFALRLGIGGALLFAGLTEKLLNPHLSELVVEQFYLTTILPLSPAQWVLFAGVTECAIGIVLILGIQTRLVSAIIFIVLIFSFFFFKEEVYSHVTLFSGLSALFTLGVGRPIGRALKTVLRRSGKNGIRTRAWSV